MAGTWFNFEMCPVLLLKLFDSSLYIQICEFLNAGCSLEVLYVLYDGRSESTECQILDHEARWDSKLYQERSWTAVGIFRLVQS